MSSPEVNRGRTECPQCGSKNLRPGGLAAPELRDCTDCHLTFRYRPVDSRHRGDRAPEQLDAIDAARTALFEKQLTRLGQPRPGELLVDIGAGSGYFVEVAARAGWDAVGVELDRPPALLARDRGRRVVVGDGEHVPVRDSRATVVTLWDVLDHLEEPHRGVTEAARVLRPGGTLWLRVRNGAVHKMMRRWRWLPSRLSVLHNNVYSPDSLRSALDRAGFGEVRVMVSPSSRGHPYSSSASRSGFGMRLAKRGWDLLAGLVARVSGGRVVASPSIAAFASRPDTPVRHE